MSVRDHGNGIPNQRRAHIFEKYFQAHTAGPWSGLGLGLHISHQIVDLHGGDIRAEFPPDGGTRFVVRFPLGLVTTTSVRSNSGNAMTVEAVEVLQERLA